MSAKETKPEKKDITVFRVTGNFRKGKKKQMFTKEICAKNKQEAEEYLLSVIGSKHRTKRREITIDKIEKIPNDKVTDIIIKQMIGGN